METKQDVQRLQEFVAHSPQVNCVALGRTTGAVLVSGGDDFLVNVWGVGKTGAIASLQGHTSAVTSVCFGKGEECVLAGSQAATIKLFDLQHAKVAKTITGHRAAVTALDMHDGGNFFASGSVDTNVKVWDRRARDNIASYVAHTGTVNTLYFSPDGRWLASGSTDGNVKVRYKTQVAHVRADVISADGVAESLVAHNTSCTNTILHMELACRMANRIGHQFYCGDALTC